MVITGINPEGASEGPLDPWNPRQSDGETTPNAVSPADYLDSYNSVARIRPFGVLSVLLS